MVEDIIIHIREAMEIVVGYILYAEWFVAANNKHSEETTVIWVVYVEYEV